MNDTQSLVVWTIITSVFWFLPPECWHEDDGQVFTVWSGGALIHTHEKHTDPDAHCYLTGGISWKSQVIIYAGKYNKQRRSGSSLAYFPKHRFLRRQTHKRSPPAIFKPSGPILMNRGTLKRSCNFVSYQSRQIPACLIYITVRIVRQNSNNGDECTRLGSLRLSSRHFQKRGKTL